MEKEEETEESQDQGYNLKNNFKNKINFYESKKYWEEIIPKDNYFIIERDEFYILRSKEAIRIKNDQ